MLKKRIPLDSKLIAIRAIDLCIATNEDVQDRLDEGCGLFVLVLWDSNGNPYVKISAISQNNLGESLQVMT